MTQVRGVIFDIDRAHSLFYKNVEYRETNARVWHSNSCLAPRVGQ
jgi:hypothetical protein